MARLRRQARLPTHACSVRLRAPPAVRPSAWKGLSRPGAAVSRQISAAHNQFSDRIAGLGTECGAIRLRRQLPPGSFPQWRREAGRAWRLARARAGLPESRAREVHWVEHPPVPASEAQIGHSRPISSASSISEQATFPLHAWKIEGKAREARDSLFAAGDIPRDRQNSQSLSRCLWASSACSVMNSDTTLGAVWFRECLLQNKVDRLRTSHRPTSPARSARAPTRSSPIPVTTNTCVSVRAVNTRGT